MRKDSTSEDQVSAEVTNNIVRIEALNLVNKVHTDEVIADCVLFDIESEDFVQALVKIVLRSMYF